MAGFGASQNSTGGRTILGRLTKRGSKDPRRRFVGAAKVTMMRPQNWQTFSFCPWLEAAATDMHHNKLGIALAKVLASFAGSVPRSGNDFTGIRGDWP